MTSTSPSWRIVCLLPQPVIQHCSPPTTSCSCEGKHTVPTQLFMVTGLSSFTRPKSKVMLGAPVQYHGCLSITTGRRVCTLAVNDEALWSPKRTSKSVELPPRQCEAVRSHCGVIRVPPQNTCPFRRNC